MHPENHKWNELGPYVGSNWCQNICLLYDNILMHLGFQGIGKHDIIYVDDLIPHLVEHVCYKVCLDEP